MTIKEHDSVRDKIIYIYIYVLHRYPRVSLPIDRDMVALHHVYSQTIKDFKTRNCIFITQSDRGDGVIILIKFDYVDKMNVIRGDTTKFRLIGPSSSYDRTGKLELKLQKLSSDVYKSDFIFKDPYNRIRPASSQRPRLYGLPKFHKNNVPLHPILSMTD